jgi:hypothetical protein
MNNQGTRSVKNSKKKSFLLKWKVRTFEDGFV